MESRLQKELAATLATTLGWDEMIIESVCSNICQQPRLNEEVMEIVQVR